MNENQTNAISEFMEYLKEKRHHNLVEMLQTMSHILCREPKTFENFDFKRINGKNVDALKNLSCLIIDEVGRCVFDKENTRMFFDVIDRRYNKDGPNNMIFTSNKSPDKWDEYFSEDSSLLCALDRIFDDAIVFMIKGKSSPEGLDLSLYL